jgi:peptidoglycan/LPS O-acetylase OafA/YrhL
MAFHLMGVPAIGEGAVASFFVLSGFLMTMIMTETYGHLEEHCLGDCDGGGIGRIARLTA